MKITIEFNSKRVKKLKKDLEIEKKLSKLHESRIKELSEQIETMNENHNNKELKKINSTPENIQA